MLDIKIDHKKLQEFTKRAHNLLESSAEITLDFKELCDEANKTTGIEKKNLSKYFKSRYKVSTKEATELGELFAHLDSVVD